MDKNKKIENIYNNNEDSTMNGEFIASFFSWIPIEKQKKKAEELNNIGSNKYKKK